MKSLLLSGHGINMNVDSGKLHIQNGRDFNKNPVEYVFKPKFIDYDNIVVYGHTGNISLDAIKWLTKQNVQLTLLNWNGRLLTTIMPIESKQSITKMVQYKAYNNGLRIELARKFIDSKIRNSLIVLNWLSERYPEIDESYKNQQSYLKKQHSLLPNSKTIGEIMGIEGRIARVYWDIIPIAFGNKLEFNERTYGKTSRPMGAIDPINALLNYGYEILASHCWKAINSTGLDAYVGFMHEMNQSKAPLVYDLQEPFRWLVDVAVITGLEKKRFTKRDFILTENYNIRIRQEGVKNLMTELILQFSSKIQYKGHNWEWGYIITQKAQELAHYLTGMKKDIDLSTPTPILYREDTSDLRNKILKTTYHEWKAKGYSKGTLHYLKKNAGNDKPFKVYGKVNDRLRTILM